MNKSATAGNAGPRIRSDCEIILELKLKGGLSFSIESKVRTLYGKSIEKLCRDILSFYRIKNASLHISDSGALPFVISARLEAAVRSVTDSESEFLPDLLPQNNYRTERDRFRFTRLYLPGNNPSLMLNAGLHSPEGIILDLEDSVAPEKKNEARILVRNALRQVDFHGAERMVRINQGDRGIEDLKTILPHNVNLILLPKCESADEVKRVEREIISLLKSDGKRAGKPVWMMPIIESAAGVENCFSIAASSPYVVALAIGLEDYTADLGVQRTREGKESLYARMRLVNAARAARIQPIDSVFSDVADTEGLEKTVRESKSLGFEGMGCIHPRQIAVIRNGFSPDADEVEKAKKIFLAWEDARAMGLGVVALGTKMIDPPVVARALKTIDLAVRLGLLGKDWAEKEERI